MTAAECQCALAQAMSKDMDVEYRKNLGGLFGMVDGQRAEALRRVRRLETPMGSWATPSRLRRTPRPRWARYST